MTPPLDKARGLIALSEKATPGEYFTAAECGEDQWEVADCGGPSEHLDGKTSVVAEQMDYCYPAEDDAAFIAAACNFARTDLPALLAEVERLREADTERMGKELFECLQLVGHALSPDLPAGTLHVGHLPDMCRDLIAKTGIEREALRADAALGRAYRRWYASAKGYCEVNIDVANNFITKDAAREGVSRG